MITPAIMTQAPLKRTTAIMTPAVKVLSRTPAMIPMVMLEAAISAEAIQEVEKTLLSFLISLTEY